jgi:hypothetical protein
MKYIYIIIALISLTISGVIGFKIGSSTVKDGSLKVTESQPIKSEVIKYVNIKNKEAVKTAIESKIIITRTYSGINNGFITADVLASDGFKCSTVQDRISVSIKTNYSTYLLIGGGALLAGILTTLYLTKDKSVYIPISQGRF